MTISIPDELHIRVGKSKALLVRPGKEHLLLNSIKFVRLRKARPDIKIVIHETGEVIKNAGNATYD